MSNFVFMDLETQSAVDLKKVGSRAYLRDPSTRLMSAVFLVDGMLIIWVPRDRAPEMFCPSSITVMAREMYPDFNAVTYTCYEVPGCIEQAVKAGATFVAHNADNFDRLAWERFVPNLKPEWYDTVHACRAAGLPAGLDKASKALGGAGKDHQGSRAMKMLCTAKVVAGKYKYVVGTPELWAELLRYNIIDVIELKRVFDGTRVLESDLLTVHRRVNDRGIPVDIPFARRLRNLWSELGNQARDEVAELTGGALKGDDLASPVKVKNWMAKQGFTVDSLSRVAIEQMLADPDGFFGDTDDPRAALVEQVIRARQSAVRTAPGKLDRVLGSADADGRVRGCFVYHGAHTGRWSARDLQPHNFPRGLSELDVELLLARWHDGRLNLGDITATAACAGGSTGDALSTLMRPIIRAPKGRRLVICDYSSVEARCVAWLSRDKGLLDAFADPNRDIYCDMASALFGEQVTKANKDRRQIGKNIVLGCIAEGTPILTDRGWVPIEDVTPSDCVWDGETWVRHGGVVFKGEKTVMDIAGVRMTPDHRVLTESGWYEACQLEESTFCLPSGKYAGNGRYDLFSADLAVGSDLSALNALVVPSAWLTTEISCPASQPDATSAPSGSPGDRRLTFLKLRERLASVCSTVSVRQSLDAPTRSTPAIPTTAGEGLPYMNPGLKTGAHSSLTCSPSKDGTTPDLKLTGETITADMNRETSDSLHGGQTHSIPGARRNTARTYDILNAGPRNRFQAGPLIVHNCGYQMGANKFGLSAKLQGCDLAKAGVSAEQCVEAYRETYPKVKGMWRAYKDAFCHMLNPERLADAIRACRCTFRREGEHVSIELPSGRKLWYREARIEPMVPVWGGPAVDTPTYLTPHGYRKAVYGGYLTENISQAVCRDLLADAMLKLDDEMWRIVMHVHDEIVCECDEQNWPTCLEDMLTIMSAPPQWAEGFPLACEGFVSEHYVKSPLPGFPHGAAALGQITKMEG